MLFPSLIVLTFKMQWFLQYLCNLCFFQSQLLQCFLALLPNNIVNGEDNFAMVAIGDTIVEIFNKCIQFSIPLKRLFEINCSKPCFQNLCARSQYRISLKIKLVKFTSPLTGLSKLNKIKLLQLYSARELHNLQFSHLTFIKIHLCISRRANAMSIL